MDDLERYNKIRKKEIIKYGILSIIIALSFFFIGRCHADTKLFEVSPMYYKSEIETQKIVRIKFAWTGEDMSNRFDVSYFNNFFENNSIECRKESIFSYYRYFFKNEIGDSYFFKLNLINHNYQNQFFNDTDYLVSLSAGIHNDCVDLSGGLGYENRHTFIEGFAYYDYIRPGEIHYNNVDVHNDYFHRFDSVLCTEYQAQMMKWQKGQSFYDEFIPLILSGSFKTGYNGFLFDFTLSYSGRIDALHHYLIDYGIGVEKKLTDKLSAVCHYDNHDNEDYSFSGNLDDYNLISAGLKYAF